ncbi:MAG: hypothetical protein NZM07_09620 [Elioraea sp.]|nr:hypothetical protein [Elioraea sp.]
MTTPQRNADLAVGLEAADADAVPGAGVYEDEGAERGIGGWHSLAWHDPHQRVDGARQGAAVEHDLVLA